MTTDRSVKVTLKGDISDYNRAMLAAAASTRALAKELDTSNERMTWMVQSSLALGPALVPITAAAVPAISGLTNQLAFAAAGAGVTALAFSGVGDALKAVNDYAIEPTEANLQKMRESLAELGPAGREFVHFLQEIRPELQELQDAAQAGLLPGAEQGIRELMALMPQVERIVTEVSGAIGDLLAEGGENLASPRWSEFFTFLETEARPTLMDMGRTLGNFAEGFANLWMAFDPLSDSFSDSFLQMSRDFAQWTDGLSETEGFQEFLDYIEANGPQAWETLSALGGALVEIVEAAAPVGSALLPVIEALADALGAVANSDAGPVLIGAAAGISAISRAVALYNVANGSALGTFLTKTAGAGAGARAAAAGIGLLGLSLTDLDESVGLSNTASYALMGAVFGPWGAAAGAAAGFTKDFAAANDELQASLDRASDALTGGSATIEQQGAAVDAARKKLDEYRDSTDGFFDQMTLKGQKNYWEGVFGDSDVEDAEAALSKLEDQYAGNVREAENLRFAQAGLSGSMDNVSDSAREQMKAILDLRDAHNKAADEALRGRDAQRDYEAAIDDAADALKENGKTLDDDTPKGRANAEAIDQIANAWNSLDYAGQQAKGGIGAARKVIIDAAKDAGATKEEIRELVASLQIKSPPPIEIKTKDLSSDVIAAIQAARDRLKDKTITIETIRKGSLSDRGNEARAPKVATGGHITGPGTGTSDSIPAWLSNGEFVVNAAATRNNLPLLHAINSRPTTRFADGGQVGGGSPVIQVASGPQTVRIQSGALEIKGGKAYITGIAQLAQAGEDNHKGAQRRAGWR